MRKRLNDYIEYLEKRLQEPVIPEERERLLADLLIQISFFQHERLVHLIVTVTFALLAMLTFFAVLALEQPALWVLLLLLLALLIPYIVHYYRLENGVQRMYKFYDALSVLA